MHLFWLPKIYIGNRHLQRYCCYWSLLGLLEIIVWVAWQRLNGSWYLAARVPANKRTLLLRCRFHARSKETVSILYEPCFFFFGKHSRQITIIIITIQVYIYWLTMFLSMMQGVWILLNTSRDCNFSTCCKEAHTETPNYVSEVFV